MFSYLNTFRKSFHWKKHIFSDFMNTYVFKTKIHGRTPFGFDLVARKFIENRMMIQGKFEIDEMEIIRRHLQSADVFVDVGANIGYYTCIALSLGKQVVAVEPQCQNLECLYANISNNGWTGVEVFPLGLSSKPGLLNLYGASGLCASLVKGWAGYSERHRQIIPVNTMDAILGGRFSAKKLFIKIDVEGAEFDVLQGAIKTLTMTPRPTWYLEIVLGLFFQGGYNKDFEATFNLFWNHNYEIHTADKEGRLITPEEIKIMQANPKSSQKVFNYVATPRP